MSVLAPLLLLSGLAGAPLLAFAQSRTVTFINKCSSDVWFSPTTGAAGTCAAGCPSTSTCASNGYCYYNKPKPSGGTYRVPKGGSNSVVFQFDPNHDTVWNGNWAFCQKGQTCNQPESVCDSQGCAALGPFALAEVDFSKAGVDFYDISIISGVTVPVSMTPTVINSGNTSPSNPYSCGNPGSPNPATAGLGASSWNLSPPSIDYQFVTPPSFSSLTTCSSPSNCPSGQTCGLIYNAGNFEHVCGYLSGFWSAGAVCGIQPSTSLMNCDAKVTNGPFSGTDSAFYGCGVTSGSCYGGGADTNCCGCVNWQNQLGTNFVPAATAPCVNSNPNWVSIVLPTIEFLKKGCPNCYTFPYDDFSSTFTCANMVNGVNVQNYDITLCPNGVSWGGTSGTTGASSNLTARTSSPLVRRERQAPLCTPPKTPPTNNATGSCSGTSYTSSQVCDNGHVCPTGQYYCGGSCYSTSNSCCSNGSLTPASGPCTCNGQGFGSSNYVCDNNFLCPSGTYSCGTACYNPSSYGCCGTSLTAVGKGC